MSEHTSEQATVERTPEEWRKSFQEEDQRWERSSQLRDWMLLAFLIAVSVGYHLLIYVFEPGLRDAG